MVDSFLQCELGALSAVRVKPGAGQRSLLCDEVEPLGTNRSVCPAARPTASRPCVLAAPTEVLSSVAKSTVTKPASCDELFGSFAEATFVTALRLFTGLDIQDTKDTEVHPRSDQDPRPSFALRARRAAIRVHYCLTR